VLFSKTALWASLESYRYEALAIDIEMEKFASNYKHWWQLNKPFDKKPE
jgi:hypothetical protein